MNMLRSEVRKKNSFDWDSFVPAAISNSMGACMIGGWLYQMQGALVGSVVGVLVALWSEYDRRRVQ